MTVRPIPLAGAAMLLAAIWALPWAQWLGYFPGHMVQHMGLVALAAPLLVLGLPHTGPVPPVLWAAALEFVAVWAWHTPGLHGAACLGGAWKLVEQATFLGTGWLVWKSALGTDAPLAGALGLLLTSMHMTLLGVLLTLAPAAIYAATCPICGSLPAQQLGGMLMLAIGTPLYLLGGLWLVARALGPDPVGDAT